MSRQRSWNITLPSHFLHLSSCCLVSVAWLLHCEETGFQIKLSSAWSYWKWTGTCTSAFNCWPIFWVVFTLYALYGCIASVCFRLGKKSCFFIKKESKNQIYLVKLIFFYIRFLKNSYCVTLDVKSLLKWSWLTITFYFVILICDSDHFTSNLSERWTWANFGYAKQFCSPNNRNHNLSWNRQTEW